MSKTFEIEKIYYSIPEVAEMFDVNASLLRFWEKEFPQLQPRKNSKGNRMYSKKDIELFKKIHELVRVQGFTLEGAKNALRQKVNETDGAAIQVRLIRVRSELVSILSSL
jgi:DNA-binding transcriptional MerR regulator